MTSTSGAAAALALVLTLPACATRGTIRELGHPEFERDVPEGQRLTLVEPTRDGELDAYPSGAREEADHRSAIRDEFAAHVEGENVVFSFLASSSTAVKLDLVQVLVYPLGPKDVYPFRVQGSLSDPEHPVAAFFNEKKYVPGTNGLRVEGSVPLAKLAGADQLATPTCLRFEDGWVTIVYRTVQIPKP